MTVHRWDPETLYGAGRVLPGEPLPEPAAGSVSGRPMPHTCTRPAGSETGYACAEAPEPVPAGPRREPPYVPELADVPHDRPAHSEPPYAPGPVLPATAAALLAQVTGRPVHTRDTAADARAALAQDRPQPAQDEPATDPRPVFTVGPALAALAADQRPRAIADAIRAHLLAQELATRTHPAGTYRPGADPADVARLDARDRHAVAILATHGPAVVTGRPVHALQLADGRAFVLDGPAGTAGADGADVWRAIGPRPLIGDEPAHEWQCPACGATTRARMADHGTAPTNRKRHPDPTPTNRMPGRFDTDETAATCPVHGYPHPLPCPDVDAPAQNRPTLAGTLAGLPVVTDARIPPGTFRIVTTHGTPCPRIGTHGAPCHRCATQDRPELAQWDQIRARQRARSTAAHHERQERAQDHAPELADPSTPADTPQDGSGPHSGPQTIDDAIHADLTRAYHAAWPCPITGRACTCNGAGPCPPTPDAPPLVGILGTQPAQDTPQDTPGTHPCPLADGAPCSLNPGGPGCCQPAAGLRAELAAARRTPRPYRPHENGPAPVEPMPLPVADAARRPCRSTHCPWSGPCKPDSTCGRPGHPVDDVEPCTHSRPTTGPRAGRCPVDCPGSVGTCGHERPQELAQELAGPSTPGHPSQDASGRPGRPEDVPEPCTCTPQSSPAARGHVGPCPHTPDGSPGAPQDVDDAPQLDDVDDLADVARLQSLAEDVRDAGTWTVHRYAQRVELASILHREPLHAFTDAIERDQADIRRAYWTSGPEDREALHASELAQDTDQDPPDPYARLDAAIATRRAQWDAQDAPYPVAGPAQPSPFPPDASELWPAGPTDTPED